MNNGGFIKFIKGNTTLTEAMSLTKYEIIQLIIFQTNGCRELVSQLDDSHCFRANVLQ